MTKILVVDDHPIILQGVEALLRDTDFEIVGQLGDGARVLEAVAKLDPDILLLDLQLPGASGIEILRAMRSTGDRRPVIFMTAAIDEATMVEAYRLGLNGLVLKHAAPDLLLICLEEVRRGGRWIDQMMLQRALDAALDAQSDVAGLGALSPREREIVDLVVAGMHNPDIAKALGIAPGTVKVHLHRIYEKVGVGSRTDLVLHARDKGWPRT